MLRAGARLFCRTAGRRAEAQLLDAAASYVCPYSQTFAPLLMDRGAMVSALCWSSARTLFPQTGRQVPAAARAFTSGTRSSARSPLPPVFSLLPPVLAALAFSRSVSLLAHTKQYAKGGKMKARATVGAAAGPQRCRWRPCAGNLRTRQIISSFKGGRFKRTATGSYLRMRVGKRHNARRALPSTLGNTCSPAAPARLKLSYSSPPSRPLTMARSPPC